MGESHGFAVPDHGTHSEPFDGTGAMVVSIGSGGSNSRLFASDSISISDAVSIRLG